MLTRLNDSGSLAFSMRRTRGDARPKVSAMRFLPLGERWLVPAAGPPSVGVSTGPQSNRGVSACVVCAVLGGVGSLEAEMRSRPPTE